MPGPAGLGHSPLPHRGADYYTRRGADGGLQAKKGSGTCGDKRAQHHLRRALSALRGPRHPAGSETAAQRCSVSRAWQQSPTAPTFFKASGS